MRKIILCLTLLLFCASSHALLDDNSTNQDQKQQQGQSQGQAQGQAAIQGNDQSSTINQGGDENTVTTAVWPETPSTAYKEEKAIYSLFGGIGSNKTEEHVRIQQAMQLSKTMFDQKIITEEEYKADMIKFYEQLKKALRPQKLLGFIPVAERGCSILNACGLLNF